jgi:hypothetical protein
VEWDLGVTRGRYVKRVEPATGKPRPEHNWVWSPQHAVNMHLPELWGLVQFAGRSETGFRPPPDEDVRWALRRLYYAQYAFRAVNGRYATRVSELQTSAAGPVDPRVRLTPEAGGYEATASGRTGTWHIVPDGRIWRQ